MDASNEFRFISSPASPLKGDRKDKELRVPVCVTNSNRNVKLRFVWDKAFKLFQSHKTIYRAMSGVTYNDYGTSVPEKRKGKRSQGCGGGDGGGILVQRSRSQTDLSGTDMTGRTHCPNCGGCRAVDEASSDLSHDEDEKEDNATKTSHQKEKCQERSSTSGGEKPRETGLGDEDDGEQHQHQQSFLLPSCPSSSSRSGRGRGGGGDEANGKNWNLPFGSDKRSHYNCGCKPIAGGGRKNQQQEHREDRPLIPFQSVHLRRSQSQKHTTRNPSSCQYGDQHDDGEEEKYVGRRRRARIGPPLEDPTRESSPTNTGYPYYDQQSPIGKSKRTLERTFNTQGKNHHRHSYSPSDSSASYGQYDSGLDTWKSPGSSGAGSIVCTISNSQNKINGHHALAQSESAPEGSRGGVKRDMRMLLAQTTPVGVNDPSAPQNPTTGMSNNNTSVVEIRKSVESLGQGEEPVQSESEDVDVEYMSEVDLNSSSSSSDDDDERTLSELKMQYLISGEGQAVYPHLLPLVSLSYPADNELDSLDLTLFETRRRDSAAAGPSELRTLKDLEAILRTGGTSAGDLCECESECHFYGTASLGSASSRRGIYSNLPGDGDGGSNWNWSDAGSEFEFMGPQLPACKRKLIQILLLSPFK